MTSPSTLRVFLDSGVILDGCISVWSAAKAVLILALNLSNLSVILADAVDIEVRRAIDRKAAFPAAGDIRAAYEGWLARVQIERWPLPTPEAVTRHAPTLLPVLRHHNDLPAVVSAIEARPDWVLSTNTAHWGLALAARTGLRIVTPRQLLEALKVQQP